MCIKKKKISSRVQSRHFPFWSGTLRYARSWRLFQSCMDNLFVEGLVQQTQRASPYELWCVAVLYCFFFPSCLFEHSVTFTISYIFEWCKVFPVHSCIISWCAWYLCGRIIAFIVGTSMFQGRVNYFLAVWGLGRQVLRVGKGCRHGSDNDSHRATAKTLGTHERWRRCARRDW